MKRKGFVDTLVLLSVIFAGIMIPLSIGQLIEGHHANVINDRNSPVINVYGNQTVNAHMGKNEAENVQKD